MTAASLMTPALHAQAPVRNETPAQHDARMKWWREAKFGLFIHWGVYAVPAGYYEGKPSSGAGEWIMNDKKIPTAAYRAFAKQFDPTAYRPDDWVRLAKEAGMKYIVITSKHHDGFALFDSKASNWNVVKATPYGKDLLKPLADACRKEKMRLGFYYSQAQDWNNPGGGAYQPKWDPAQEGDFDTYLDKVAIPQIEEILSHYGTVSVLWFDTPANMTPARAARVLPVIQKLQPDIVINNRLGGDFPGDTETPEQYIPATGFKGHDWESCMTMNDTWGFKRDDNDWKSTPTLIHNLVDIVSKGGNYLLNVGPTAEGRIPDASIERLKAIGKWMRLNHEAIYGTTASPFRMLPWGRCTVKAEGNETTLYLHVFDWPTNGRLVVPGLTSPIKKAYLLDGNRAVQAVSEADRVILSVPKSAPDPISSTVVLKIAGAPQVQAYRIKQEADGTLRLRASEATTIGSRIQYESGGGRDNLGYWTDPADGAEWPVTLSKAGQYKVVAEIATAEGGQAFTVTVGDQTVRATAPATGEWTKFQTVEMGTITLSSTGPATIAVHAVADGWHPINLKSLTFVPIPPQ